MKKRIFGFTVVELVVAVGVIGILGAVVVVRLLDYRAKAKQSQLWGNVTQLQNAYERAKMTNPEVLTNSTLRELSDDLLAKGLLNKRIADVSQISITSGTAIPDRNALFVPAIDYLSNSGSGTNSNGDGGSGQAGEILPPVVTVNQPSASGNYFTGQPLNIQASAAMAGGTVNTLEIYFNSVQIGSFNSASYSGQWTPPSSGDYAFQVKATGAGKTGSSPVITVSVHDNQLPTVSLTTPTEGQVFIFPDPVTFAAEASDDAGLTQVEFLQGSNPIQVVAGFGPSFVYNWAAPVGDYAVKAIANDRLGASQATAPVTIKVIPNTSPSVSMAWPTSGAYGLENTLDL